MHLDPDVAPHARVRKPSKRAQHLDPLAPLTPAQPRVATSHSRPKQLEKKTPTAPLSNFASRQIQGSQNQRAAAVLFTPRTKQHVGPVPACRQQSSPTPHTPHPHTVLQFESESSSASEVEEDLGAALQGLNLQSQPGAGSQHPHAGPHSMHKRRPRPRAGAKDVWTFIKKSSEQHICVLCECVLVL